MESNQMDVIGNEKKETNVPSVEMAKVTQEVQAQIISAKKFPREVGKVYDQIIDACKIKTLASSAEYLLPISGRSISGPSVRLAEVIFQSYGNAELSTRLLEEHDGFGIYESYFIDYEKNIKKSVKYKIKYTRYSKAKGHVKLHDGSDIKRAVNRIAALHERDCLLKGVPKYLIDSAINQCRATLKQGGETLPERINKMVSAFGSLESGKVTREDIEARLGHSVDEMSSEQVSEYGKIFNSLREGATKRKDWFETKKEASEKTKELNEQLKGKPNEK